MSLNAALTRAKTEEDVKDAYIEALGLKSVHKGLVDIQTPEIWFEAKEAPTPPLLMFAQLLVYVRAARKRGEAIPGFLCVIDREKAALMATEHVIPLLKDKSIVWPKAASAADMALTAQIAPTIQTHFILYQIDDYEAEFIKATKDAVSEGRIIRTPITPDNLRQVFDKWVAMVGVELGVKDEADYAVLFFADIMHDGRDEAMRNLPARLLFSGNKPVFIIGADQYELASERGYRNFWNIYHRPPEKEHRHYLLERRDSLLPMDDQKFKGAFYTPLHIVDKAYDQLTATLGANWQKKYIVWDMCAGVGNLEAKHSNLRNVYMSTLDQEDVTIMRSNPAFAGAEIFQYDYLNDDVDDFGQIDYDLSGKLPTALRQAIADARERKKGAKPILVLINPPYAEATSSDNAVSQGEDRSKKGVARSRYSLAGMNEFGKASNELFTQFLARAYDEIPNAKIALFSTLKYVNSQAFEEFRTAWHAKYLGGLVVHSRAFDGLKGDFPIGFLIWDTGERLPINEAGVVALDRDGIIVGEKSFVNIENSRLLATWVPRPATNKSPAIPLKGAILPATAKADVRGTRWSDDAIGWFNCAGNDLQQAAKLTMMLSSGFGSGRGYFVNSENLWQAAIVFSVRRLIKPTWLNDRDQFLQPSQPLSDEFKSDCLVWMLFNGSNLTAGADGLRWNDRDWTITNHFIPYTEAEVGAKARFESDFMVSYMAGMAFSPEAQAVLDEGRKVFQRFHARSFPNKIREEYKLGRADAGWYQVRRALEAFSDTEFAGFDPFKAKYADLSAKLRPQVFELGFLPS
ncbi:hypothetical protein ACFFUT_12465 [Pseudohalocynthiibacter aestuariivivens]|uniref:Class I SAM-dependent DNA methyltransferase n=1 Tax=Pseudohalocynthiibacter aestuariivivens TaxID=1591409 RepID=A0ABV5JGM0_9RHOB|nr:hypothetical protein [Pseudohalocynthiibacter aestuariivivens]MBS9718964.1 hypothetical protein [Pseudohalocynthiibacter aestuariivivens]